MSFRFDRKRSVADSVPRIVRKQAEKAAAGLRQRENAAAGIHVARTSSKRLRGLLRLLRPELGSRYHVEEKRLGRIQKALGPLRDAQVLLETFDEHFGFRQKAAKKKSGEKNGGDRKSTIRKKSPGALPEIRLALETRALSERLDGDVPDRIEAAYTEFRKLRRRAERFVPSRGKRGGGFRAIERGLEATYRRGRRARDAAYEAGTASAFHDWRKAVKYHGYHLKLLAEIEPVELRARIEDAEALGELLGKDHDLSVLAEALETLKGEFSDDAQYRAALESIARAQRELRQRAEPLGRRLFAETPAEFSGLMRELFRAWREGGGPGRLAAPPPEPQ
jgi:CHAD domain-containing protein